MIYIILELFVMVFIVRKVASVVSWPLHVLQGRSAPRDQASSAADENVSLDSFGNDLEAFLTSLDMVRFLPNFQAEEIDLIDVPMLSAEHLERLGLPLGPRLRLLRALSALTSPSPQPRQSAASSTSPRRLERRNRHHSLYSVRQDSLSEDPFGDLPMTSTNLSAFNHTQASVNLTDSENLSSSSQQNDPSSEIPGAVSFAEIDQIASNEDLTGLVPTLPAQPFSQNSNSTQRRSIEFLHVNHGEDSILPENPGSVEVRQTEQMNNVDGILIVEENVENVENVEIHSRISISSSEEVDDTLASNASQVVSSSLGQSSSGSTEISSASRSEAMTGMELTQKPNGFASVTRCDISSLEHQEQSMSGASGSGIRSNSVNVSQLSGAGESSISPPFTGHALNLEAGSGGDGAGVPSARAAAAIGPTVAAATLAPVTTPAQAFSPETRTPAADSLGNEVSDTDLAIPTEFICPITQEMMEHPVFTSDGHTYERAGIARWLGEGRRTSPRTGALLADLALRPNHSLRSQIIDFREKKSMPALAPWQPETLETVQPLPGPHDNAYSSSGSILTPQDLASNPAIIQQVSVSLPADQLRRLVQELVRVEDTLGIVLEELVAGDLESPEAQAQALVADPRLVTRFLAQAARSPHAVQVIGRTLHRNTMLAMARGRNAGQGSNMGVGPVLHGPASATAYNAHRFVNNVGMVSGSIPPRTRVSRVPVARTSSEGSGARRAGTQVAGMAGMTGMNSTVAQFFHAVQMELLSAVEQYLQQHQAYLQQHQQDHEIGVSREPPLSLVAAMLPPDMETPLHLAARAGNVRITQLLLHHGADPTARTSIQATPIHYAASAGQTEVVRVLLAGTGGRALMQSRAARGETPLHLAAAAGRLPTVQLLLAQGAEPDVLRDDNNSILHLASMKGHAGVVETLLATGRCSVNRVSSAQGMTSLHLACVRGSSRTLTALLNAGANPHLPCAGGVTPLHLAASHGHALLLSRLAPIRTVNINALDDNGCSALQNAASKGHTDAVRVLAQIGADLGPGERRDCQTPLHIAAWNGCANAVKALLENGAAIEALAANGSTALHYSAWQGHAVSAQVLIRSGANLMACTFDGDTPLHQAVFRDHMAMVELLLGAGADIDAQKIDGCTALHLCAMQGLTTMTNLLLAKGAQQNIPNQGGNLPLDLATQFRNTAVVTALSQFT